MKHLHAIVGMGFYGMPALPSGAFPPSMNQCSRLEWWDVERDGYALAGAPKCYKEYRRSVEAHTLRNASTLRPRARAGYVMDQRGLEWFQRHCKEKVRIFNEVVDAEEELEGDAWANYVREWEIPTIHYKVGMADPMDSSFMCYWR